jgi:two-component system OmpR family response regulator
VQSNSQEERPGPRKVVLVIEDEPAIGELIAGAIGDEPGFCAIHVAEPGEALETAKSVRPDVFVIDVRLPGMTGLELYDKLLRDDPRMRSVPVLFETASGKESEREFRRRGIATYVQKPFDLWAIVAYVKRLAAGAASRRRVTSPS